MRKISKLFLCALVICVAASLVGCSLVPKTLQEAVAGGVADSRGRIGEQMSNNFFNFTVTEINVVDTYGGYTAAAGTQLIDVVVTIENTFGDTLPMYNSDFFVEWGSAEDECVFGVEGVDSPRVMPEEYELAADDSGMYHIIYEVPADATKLAFVYLEVYEDDTTGPSNYVDFTINGSTAA